jgi:carboxypeptidase Taq
MYAAQILNTAKKRMPDLDDRIAAGELAPLKDWLSEGVYRHGKMKEPSEIIQGITGEALNSKYLCDYLEAKYNDVYRLK